NVSGPVFRLNFVVYPAFGRKQQKIPTTGIQFAVGALFFLSRLLWLDAPLAVRQRNACQGLYSKTPNL
ncbi:MAG: hypothetical protein ABF722_09980, partial [Lacticaseibacillus paracasei]